MTFPRQTDLPVAPAPREVIITPEPQDVSAVGFVNVLLRYRTFIIIMTLAFGFYAGYKSVTSSKGYTTYASFMPKGARGSGQLGGIAAQFGINLQGGDAASSPQLYTDLLETRTILLPVAMKNYRSATKERGVVEGNLIEVFNIQGRQNVREQRVVQSLRNAIKGTVIAKTGVIEMNVTTGSPELSFQIANNLLAQLNEYNLSTRQASAALEREFIERQVQEKEADLRAAEQRLSSFLERNRTYRTSPQLMVEYGRLQAQLDMRQTFYARMLEGYNSARIEEVRNLPVLSIIEAPQLPIGPNPRGGVKRTGIGLITGFTIAVLLAFVRDRFVRSRATGSEEVLEFAALKREAIGDLTHPWRPITRAFSARKSK